MTLLCGARKASASRLIALEGNSGKIAAKQLNLGISDHS
jgi:hypothetical protein